jgi:N6-adenosine-specific RNA methylase IME4
MTPRDQSVGSEAVAYEQLSLDDLAQEIRQELAAAEADWQSAVQHGIRAGELLIEAKSRVRHGEWLPWLETNFPDSVATAELYMKLARNSERVQNLTSIRSAVALLTERSARDDKEVDREAERERNRELVKQAPRLSEIDETFPTIMLDPPWDWGDEGDVDQFGRATPTYATMPFDEIADEPVGKLAKKNAHLYLWITNRSLPKGFELFERWGFRYVTALTWVKPSIGMGNYFRGSTEHVLFGIRGSRPLLRHDVGTHFEAPRQERHSGKPPEFYELVESCSPGPWFEWPARQQRNGWVCYGTEI